MALSRGGDQAVVRNQVDFAFYGGRTKATEKRTKVKSRVMANAFRELIADAGEVYIMGHSFADMDAVGAAAGIFQFLLALLDQLVTLLLGAFQGMLSLIAGLFGVTLSNLQLQL